MFLVVFAHLYSSESSERLYIYAFHMPFFFYVSGMLHKKMPVLRGALKYSKTLLIPTLSFLIIGGIVNKLFYGWHFLQFVVACWDSGYNSWGFPQNGVVWFLIALFYVKVLVDIYFSNKFIALILWGTLMYFTYVYTNPFFLCSGMMAFPIYLIGFHSKSLVIRMSQVDWIKWTFPLFFATSVALTWVNGRVSMIGHSFGLAPVPYNYAFFYINGIIGTFGMLFLSFFIKKQTKLITIIGTSLITIVGLQQLFINIYEKNIASESYLLTIPATIVIMALCCLAHRLIDHYCPFLLGKSILPTFDDYYGIVHDFVCSFLPLQKKIVFDNFGGRGMGDDPKYIALYFKEHHPDIKLIWLLSDMNTPMPDGIIPVYIHSHKARYHLYTARIWVDNIKNFKKTPKRKGQFYLQTWHGGLLGMKLAEAQVEHLLTPEYVKAARFDASITDMMYADNDFVKDIYEKDFWYHGKVLKCDLPRISILLNPSEHLKSRISDYYHIQDNKKIVLYAPTFRAIDDLSVFVWNYESILDILELKFGGEFVMLLRMHPNFASVSNRLAYSERVISASDYPDMQELMAVSDVLISDYSGCAFEFAITRKPVFLYGPDVDSYSQKERGLLFKLRELPFRMNTTIDELNDAIQRFSEKEHQAVLDEFYYNLGLEESGQGNRKISEILLQQL